MAAQKNDGWEASALFDAKHLVHYHLTLGSPGRILTDSMWQDRLKGSNHLKPNPSYQQGLSGAK
jgi:hypothetical protein